jgi:hypothetical protein
VSSLSYVSRSTLFAGASWMPLKPQHQASQLIGTGRPELRRCSSGRALSLGVMLERDWRQMYMRGVTPEDAADRAQALLEHARFEHMGKR